MNGLKGAWVFLLLLLHSSTGYCVEAVAAGAVFHRITTGGRDSAFAEVYFDVNPASLHYHKNTDGSLVAQLQVAVSISDDTAVLQRDRYILQPRPAQPGAAARQRIFQFKRYAVPAGRLSLRIDIGEADFPRETFRYDQSLQTLDTVRIPHFSDIQLLDTFFKSTEPGLFVKDGYRQEPRILNFFDEGQRRLSFYTELYAGDRQGQELIRHYYISRKANDYPIIRLQLFDTLQRAAAINPGRYTLDLSTLSSGNYYLNAHLRDRQGAFIDTQSFFFQMINAHPEEVKVSAQDSANAARQETNFLDLSVTFVKKFSVKQIIAILKMLRPVADPSEARTIDGFLARPDETYMRYFVYNYFSKQNRTHPEDAWKQFSNLIREVNGQFNGGGKMGYETDRGRVYLQYGKPDERLKVPNEAGAVPYEVWRYNAIGSTNQIGTFVFYQPGFSISDFILLTSTVTGELYNPDWRTRLYSTGRSSGNGNSVAERYMEGK